MLHHQQVSYSLRSAYQSAALSRKLSPRRPTFGRRLLERRHALQPVASAKADELLIQARVRYEKGDRLTAMRLFEGALEKATTSKQRQAALFGATAVHASFGDAELAQMTLRDAVREGLDFDMAVNDLELVQISSSPQIMIQLRGFAKKVRQAMLDGPTRPSANRPASTSSSSSSSSMRSSSLLPDQRSQPDVNLDDIIGPLNPDDEGIDATPAGIAKRVALLLLALIGLGVALWYLGLEYAF